MLHCCKLVCTCSYCHDLLTFHFLIFFVHPLLLVYYMYFNPSSIITGGSEQLNQNLKNSTTACRSLILSIWRTAAFQPTLSFTCRQAKIIKPLLEVYVYFLMLRAGHTEYSHAKNLITMLSNWMLHECLLSGNLESVTLIGGNHTWKKNRYHHERTPFKNTEVINVHLGYI